MSADVYWSRPSSRLDRPSWKMAPHLLSGKAAGRSNDRPRPSIKDVRRRAAIFESIFLEHNTRRGDRAGAKAYPSFCERYGLGFEPTPDTLALFLGKETLSGKKPSKSIKGGTSSAPANISNSSAQGGAVSSRPAERQTWSEQSPSERLKSEPSRSVARRPFGCRTRPSSSSLYASRPTTTC
jgi:hypothetical protein